MPQKIGIATIGSTIADEVCEPLEVGNLVYSDGYRYLEGDDYETENIEYTVGGLALNDGIDLARMKGNYPIRVIGKIGDDSEGKLIKTILSEAGLSDEFLIITPDHPTSKTQVIHFRDSDGNIKRSFRHFFGAMGSLMPDEIDLDVLDGIRIAIIGYGLVIPNLDRPNEKYGTEMGSVLARIRERGIQTVLDFATPKREQWWKFERYRKSLRFVDILSIGEDQAEALTDISNEQDAAQSLVEDFHVRIGVVHCGDRGTNYLYSRETGMLSQRIFKIPSNEFKGTVGAGDAFTAGLVHGIHQEWKLPKCLLYATAASAISIGSLNSTGAMREEQFILDYMETRPTV